MFVINSPANKVSGLNARAEERCHLKVFPLECITELLSQTIANRDRQIEVVTQERQMRERNREEIKRHGGGASLLLQYSVGLRRRRYEEERGDGRGGEERKSKTNCWKMFRTAK